jgi:hypothetical protein
MQSQGGATPIRTKPTHPSLIPRETEQGLEALFVHKERRANVNLVSPPVIAGCPWQEALIADKLATPYPTGWTATSFASTPFPFKQRLHGLQHLGTQPGTWVYVVIVHHDAFPLLFLKEMWCPL